PAIGGSLSAKSQSSRASEQEAMPSAGVVAIISRYSAVDAGCSAIQPSETQRPTTASASAAVDSARTVRARSCQDSGVPNFGAVHNSAAEVTFGSLAAKYCATAPPRERPTTP